MISRGSEFQAKFTKCFSSKIDQIFSLLRYLLERDFPGMRIGPEPTTDNFHVIEHADEDGKIPGEKESSSRNIALESYLNDFQSQKQL